MTELREEMKNVIKIIAQEYIEQYPVSTMPTANAGGKRLISSGKIRIIHIQYENIQMLYITVFQLFLEEDFYQISG